MKSLDALDALDRRLVAVLRDDGRAPISRLAKDLQISRGTVQNRLDRLIESGVIRGFAARLRHDIDDGAVRALMMIEMSGKSTAAVIKPLRGIPEIRAVHTTTGKWGVIAEIRTNTLTELDLVLTAVRMIDGVLNTETSILLTSTT